MLTRLRFQNYRAYAKGDFAIKPITVLVGANSIGKTSALQLPLILKQTASVSHKNYRSALKIHGREANIGDPKNLFFNQSIDRPLELSCEFISAPLFMDLTQRFQSDFHDFLALTVEYYAYLSNVAGSKIKKSQPSEKIVQAFRNKRTRDLLSDEEFFSIKEFLGAHSKLFDELPKETLPPPFAFRYPLNRSGTRYLRKGVEYARVSTTDLERYFHFLKALKHSVTSRNFTFSVKISFDQKMSSGDGDQSEPKQLTVSELAIGHRTDDIIRAHFDGGSLSKLSSSLVERKMFDGILRALDPVVTPASSIFSVFSPTETIDSNHHFTEFVRGLFCTFQDAVGSLFSEKKIGHIGPLRAHPKRFYFLDTAEAGASEGNLLVESLREDPQLRDKVNNWLAAFSINISVAQLEQIIFRLSVRNEGHAFDLDITDVGFGISQILPILVEGFGAPLDKVILIEQPEIHLHPKMQGELADLFIDISNVKAAKDEADAKRRYLVIETHSEYFLSRLRRRISEGKISHSDVAVYFVERAKERAGSIIQGVHMPPSGDFAWPEEFFEDDLEDTLVVLRNKAKSGQILGGDH
jgi:predicted ATPase